VAGPRGEREGSTPRESAELKALKEKMQAEIALRTRVTEESRRQSRLLAGINAVFQETLSAPNDRDVARVCLSVAEDLTGSRFGFMCEVNPKGRLDTIAISNPGWEACRIPDLADKDAAAALNDLEIRGIRGLVITTGRSMIFNDPASHPQWFPPPPGHPTITAFLGVPLKRAGKTVGTIGLGNREGGFTPANVEDIETLAAAFLEAVAYKRLAMERETLIEELEKRNAEMERLTYTVSHDLRTPLVTIKGFSGMLAAAAETGDLPKVKAKAGRIITAADRMRLLLDEVLEFSRIGRVVRAREDVPLKSVVQDTLAVLSGAIKDRGVSVKVASDLPVVRGDRVRLAEVVQNLIQNAVGYLGEQPAPRVEIGVRRDGDETVCYVRDNGIGIDLRYREKVFGLFERLDANTEGAGVGLAIVKRIVEAHGGRVWVESEGAGKGATFCFTIPGTALPKE
jgi:signal transduction histidine kinase